MWTQNFPVMKQKNKFAYVLYDQEGKHIYLKWESEPFMSWHHFFSIKMNTLSVYALAILVRIRKNKCGLMKGTRMLTCFQESFSQPPKADSSKITIEEIMIYLSTSNVDVKMHNETITYIHEIILLQIVWEVSGLWQSLLLWIINYKTIIDWSGSWSIMYLLLWNNLSQTLLHKTGTYSVNGKLCVRCDWVQRLLGTDMMTLAEIVNTLDCWASPPV